MGRCNGGRVAFAILGACVLLPYNCLLLGQPYFNDYPFKNMQFPFTSMISYSISLCLGQVVLTFAGENWSVSSRMVLSFVGTNLVCIALFLISFGTWTAKSVMYAPALVAVAMLGVLNALMQTALTGLAGTIGQEMSGAAMLGFGISGFISLILSLSVQVVEHVADVSEEFGGYLVTLVAFGFCLLYTLASGGVYRYLSRGVSQAVEALGALEHRRSSREIGAERTVALRAADVENTQEETSRRAKNSGPEGGKFRRTIAVLGEVLPQAFNVWLVFVVTMMIFPGVVTQWKPRDGSFFVGKDQLFGTLLIGCFQVFDVIGRALDGLGRRWLPPPRLWMFVALRCLFIPLFILGQRRPDWCLLWGSDAGRLLLVAALATSNGFFASCAMMFGPERCDNQSREVAGIAMSCTMVCGIFAGSLFALVTQL